MKIYVAVYTDEYDYDFALPMIQISAENKLEAFYKAAEEFGVAILNSGYTEVEDLQFDCLRQYCMINILEVEGV